MMTNNTPGASNRPAEGNDFEASFARSLKPSTSDHAAAAEKPKIPVTVPMPMRAPHMQGPPAPLGPLPRVSPSRLAPPPSTQQHQPGSMHPHLIHHPRRQGTRPAIPVSSSSSLTLQSTAAPGSTNTKNPLYLLSQAQDLSGAATDDPAVVAAAALSNLGSGPYSPMPMDMQGVPGAGAMNEPFAAALHNAKLANGQSALTGKGKKAAIAPIATAALAAAGSNKRKKPTDENDGLAALAGGGKAPPAKKDRKTKGSTTTVAAAAAASEAKEKAMSVMNNSFDTASEGGDSFNGYGDGEDYGQMGSMKGLKGETDNDKRKSFLERNRQAALKCRQRKKAWLANLQSKVEFLTVDNDTLQSTVNNLKEEIASLRAILSAHAGCPIAVDNGVHGVSGAPTSAGRNAPAQYQDGSRY